MELIHWTYLLLLFTGISLALADVHHRTELACEGAVLHLQCEKDKVIRLIRANFGRYSIARCNDHGNTDWSVNCMGPGTDYILKSMCDAKQSCHVNASSGLFGDPCRGTHKYLEAHYNCVSEMRTTSRPKPPWYFEPNIEWHTVPSVPNQKSAPGKFANVDVSKEEASSSTKYSETTIPKTKETTKPMVTTETIAKTDSTDKPSIVSNFEDDKVIDPWLVTTPTPRNKKHFTTAPRLTTTHVPSVSHINHGQLNSKMCPRVVARGLTWDWAVPDDKGLQPCPGGATGYASWMCVGPHRLAKHPDLSQCKSAWLTSLETRAQEEKESFVKVAKDLVQFTSTKQLYGGDIEATALLLDKIASVVKTEMFDSVGHEFIKDLVEAIVKTGSNVLSADKFMTAWMDLTPEAKQKSVSNLLVALEKNAFVLAESSNDDVTYVQNEKSLTMVIKVMTYPNIRTVYLPSSIEHTSVENIVDINVTLPGASLFENAHDGVVRVIFFLFENLHEILQPEVLTQPVGLSRKVELDHRILNSKVFGTSLKTGRHLELPEPVTMVVRHLNPSENYTNPSCVFWDYSIDYWSSVGCRIVHSNLTHTACECDHLTHFAILMDVISPIELAETHTVILEFITLVGCVISIVCLLAAILTFYLLKSLKGDRTTIHLNLCICLLVAEVVFLAGINKTDNKIWCSVTAGFLHYFFLAAFVWMFFEGFQLYVMLIEVFETEKSRVKWYYCLSYGCPAVVVAVSCIVDPFSYGTEYHCWLRADNYFIFSFIGPVILILIANFIFLGMTIYVMCRHVNIPPTIKDERKVSRAGSMLRGIIALVTLLGLTWFFGLFFISNKTVTMAYLFTVLNSLQGLFIFIFTCIQNEKVRKEYMRLFLHADCSVCLCGSDKKDSHSSFYVTATNNTSQNSSNFTETSGLRSKDEKIFYQGKLSHYPCGVIRVPQNGHFNPNLHLRSETLGGKSRFNISGTPYSKEVEAVPFNPRSLRSMRNQGQRYPNNPVEIPVVAIPKPYVPNEFCNVHGHSDSHFGFNSYMWGSVSRNEGMFRHEEPVYEEIDQQMHTGFQTFLCEPQSSSFMHGGMEDDINKLSEISRQSSRNYSDNKPLLTNGDAWNRHLVTSISQSVDSTPVISREQAAGSARVAGEHMRNI